MRIASSARCSRYAAKAPRCGRKRPEPPASFPLHENRVLSRRQPAAMPQGPCLKEGRAMKGPHSNPTVKAAKNGHSPELKTKEPQYQFCLDIKEESGLTELGLMTNQCWHDDPRRLAFFLARYKFVSKMLRGKGS